MLSQSQMSILKQLARGIAAQFGSNCEVVIHEIREGPAEGTIVCIENGHVTGRRLGDGPSQVVLEQMHNEEDSTVDPADRLCYLTRTPDGKLLKSSSFYIRDGDGRVSAIFCINFDISALAMAGNVLGELTMTKGTPGVPKRIATDVEDLLDDLIEQSVQLVGKPVALMNKEDKIRALQFLNGKGALLITKSGDKIARYFGISKYTLYSYLDN